MDRRPLDYARIDQIMPDVDRLLRSHATAGNWTLGAICDHLAKAISLTLRGARPDVEPSPSTPEQDLARREFFRARAISTGLPMPTPRIVPDTVADPQSCADALRQAIDRLVSQPPPYPTHPHLGPLTHDEWLQFHCIHCAHHLSFAVPT
jgi:hypothetical protein